MSDKQGGLASGWRRGTHHKDVTTGPSLHEATEATRLLLLLLLLLAWLSRLRGCGVWVYGGRRCVGCCCEAGRHTREGVSGGQPRTGGSTVRFSPPTFGTGRAASSGRCGLCAGASQQAGHGLTRLLLLPRRRRAAVPSIRRGRPSVAGGGRHQALREKASLVTAAPPQKDQPVRPSSALPQVRHWLTPPGRASGGRPARKATV